MSLRELQAEFRETLLGGEPSEALRHVIAGDGIAVAARLAIYAHHVGATLTDVLRAAFPVVCRLVDDRFFRYAAAQFIAASPPSSPCLHEYGDAFADFIAAFPPCHALPYLADVARLEWTMHRAAHADDAVPLDAEALSALPAETWSDVRLSFHPSLTLLASPWPVDRIWRANQPDADPRTVVELDAGSACLEVRRRDDTVVFRALDAGDFALRHALLGGRTLGEAAEAALAADLAFDLSAALTQLFHDDSVVALARDAHKEDDRCTRRP